MPEGDPNNKRFVMSGAGSPRYMAPECLDGQSYNMKADVYSFAIIVWEILADQSPYAFIREYNQLMREVVVRHVRPVIDESWPNRIVGMLESSFDADIKNRPVSWLCLTDSLVYSISPTNTFLIFFILLQRE